jgi:hypothetical protein
MFLCIITLSNSVNDFGLLNIIYETIIVIGMIVLDTILFEDSIVFDSNQDLE